MRKAFKVTAMVSVLGLSGVGSGPALAELSANVGMTSNYIWRGVTQTDDQAAVSGGIDWTTEAGFYLGTWVSNVTWTVPDGYEVDIYGGYAGEAGSVSYDVGAIYYGYPVGDAEDDFSEVYGSLGFGPVTGFVAYTVDTEAGGKEDDHIYYSLAADFPLKKDLSLGLLVGSYDFAPEATEDYNHYQVALTKSTAGFGDFTFAIDQNDLENTGAGEDDPRVSVAWNLSFDL